MLLSGNADCNHGRRLCSVLCSAHLGDVGHDAAERVELLVELAAAVALHEDVLVRPARPRRRPSPGGHGGSPRRRRGRVGPVGRARVVVGHGVLRRPGQDAVDELLRLEVPLRLPVVGEAVAHVRLHVFLCFLACCCSAFATVGLVFKSLAHSLCRCSLSCGSRAVL